MKGILSGLVRVYRAFASRSSAAYRWSRFTVPPVMCVYAPGTGLLVYLIYYGMLYFRVGALLEEEQGGLRFDGVDGSTGCMEMGFAKGVVEGFSRCVVVCAGQAPGKSLFGLKSTLDRGVSRTAVPTSRAASPARLALFQRKLGRRCCPPCPPNFRI